MLNRGIQRIPALLWALMVLLIPITSMPLVVQLVRSDAVAAPSGLVLGVLVIVWFVPYLIRGGRLPRQFIPLAAFVLALLLASAFSVFLDLPSYKDFSPISNQFKAFLTLAVGVCFFLLGSTWPATPGRLRMTLKWMNWVGLLVIAWSLAQAAAWLIGGRYPQWMRNFHDLYSVAPLYRQRVSGFAFEPSWLANQLNLLYLPLWLAAVVRRQSSHQFRLWKFIFEDLLLAGGIVVLLLTLSRVGLVAFLMTVGLLLWRVNLRVVQWRKSRLNNQDGSIKQIGALRAGLIRFGIPAGLILLYAATFLAVGLVLSQADPIRMRKLFDFSMGTDNPILRYANQLMFASRMVYWQAGWNIFSDYPIFGVGLGNAGYLIPNHFSGYAFGLVEVRDLLYRTHTLLNVKSLWVRILAEGGIVSMAFFASWLFLLWRTARIAERSKLAVNNVIGLAGKLTIIALIMEGFSVDSFAFPYPWLILGLLTAAVMSSNREVTKRQLNSEE